MGKQLLRRKHPGQSIVFIALVFAVLVGMVGLSVDVGHTLSDQRAAQRAANSAAIEGVDSMLKNRSDQQIYKDIEASLRANKINVVGEAGTEPGPGQTAFTATYFDERGVRVGLVGDTFGTRPPSKETTYIQVALNGKTETYLARLFNRPTLPVVVDSFGGRGPCFTGIYPLGVRDGSFSGVLAANSPNGGVYRDGFYRDKPWRRLFLADSSPLRDNGFAWLRWSANQASGSLAELKRAMSDDGTIDEAFEEAPWPADTNLAGPKPEGYPYRGGYLDTSDWVYGASANVSDFSEQLNFHIRNRTELLLPIYKAVQGSGANGQYHVVAMGRFLVKTYGNDPNYSGEPYIDLVYLGPNNGCPTLISPPVPDDRIVNLSGNVLVTPRALGEPRDKLPADLIFVLDESDSMGWRWEENRIPGSTNPNSSNPARYLIVRKALKNFIDQYITENDRMSVIKYGNDTGDETYGPGRQFSQGEVNDAVNRLTDLLADFTKGDTAGKNQLKQRINDYSTRGSTPSAVGLERARRQLELADDTREFIKRDSSGNIISREILPVKKVIILMTDGVANTYLNGKFRVCNGGSRESESCVDELRAEGQPIDQLVKLANKIQADKGSDLTIYAIAMGELWGSTNLRNVATAPSNFYLADQASELEPAFRDIMNTERNPTCVATKEAAQAPVDGGRLDDSGQVGYIELLKDDSVVARSEIQIVGGNAVYSFPNIQAASYSLRGQVKYKGADGQFRIYTLVSSNGQQWGDKVNYKVTGEATEDEGPTLTFDLAGGGVCPTPNP